MSEAKTVMRINWPTVMLVGAESKGPPGYLRALEDQCYSIERAVDATAARTTMGLVMPHVVVLSRSVPMVEHRHIHETAKAVGAEVLLTPDDAHPELVTAEVGIVMERAQKRRNKH